MRPSTIDRKYYEQAKRNDIKVKTFETRIYKYKWTPEEASTTPTKQTAERFRKRMEKVETEAAAKVPTFNWTPEQIAEHLAAIGPDKNFDAFHNRKASNTAITAPREKTNGHYFKPGEAW